MDDMDLKNPTTQKWLLGGLACLAAGYFWYTKVYVSYQEKIEASYTRLEALETEVKNVEMKFRSLDALKQEYSEITSRYRNVSQLLPEENQLSPLLTKIHGAALETSSRVALVEPLLPASEGFYERESFRLTVHSTFHDFGDFLSRMSNLPFIVNVQDVELAQVEDRDNPDMENGGYTLTARMNISTYHVKESERLILIDQPSIAQKAGE